MNTDTMRVLLSEVTMTIDVDLMDSVSVKTILTTTQNRGQQIKLNLSKFTSGGGGGIIL